MSQGTENPRHNSLILQYFARKSLWLKILRIPRPISNQQVTESKDFSRGVEKKMRGLPPQTGINTARSAGSGLRRLAIPLLPHEPADRLAPR
jgi:hypothetical protein